MAAWRPEAPTAIKPTEATILFIVTVLFQLHPKTDSANSKSYVFLLENHSHCQIYLHFFLHPMNRTGRKLFAEVQLRRLNMVLPISRSLLPRPHQRLQR